MRGPGSWKKLGGGAGEPAPPLLGQFAPVGSILTRVFLNELHQLYGAA